ncbi:Bug family tripartite tricarboxylate transporter substrate binding protein [Pararoseomonas indoligenes]|uniref:Tripartite tricarboxylate transporter substrate binding protein n=1 Tax=Roseomonas indoligenes TaxID=2820811 RepID=A0A940N3I7_9PROT|nr:tripartite tricarboxylate transporter substrate binding protein [Pararoseomonas indoligenes]MBP0495924.1 tripartite tricarboxylate transporter substrate binding protein [Pararoseomonas indoligenes]
MKLLGDRAVFMMQRRHFGAALLAGLAAPRLAPAQEAWPARPVRIVAPFAPGGAPDVAIRLALPRLTERLGQPFVVENRPGGNGTIAAEAVARAAPDGYTLLLATNSVVAINPALFGPRLAYQPEKDFVPIARLARLPFFLFVPAHSPARDLKGLFAQARSARQPLAYATNGSGTVGHLATEQLQRAAGIELTHAPYRGYPAALADLIAGRVDLCISDLTVFGGPLRGGQLRALAAVAPERSPFLPDVPALPELGFPALDGSVWFGLFAPAGTPEGVIARLDQELRDWLALEATRAGLANISQEPAYLGRETLPAQLRQERARYAEVIASAGIRPD